MATISEERNSFRKIVEPLKIKIMNDVKTQMLIIAQNTIRAVWNELINEGNKETEKTRVLLWSILKLLDVAITTNEKEE